MKVLFAVSNESVSQAIIKKYQQMYKEIIISKNVYYFNAIIKELQKDKTYDRIVISEDLEPFTNNNIETIDNFIFEKLDNISDEATTSQGEDIPVILIAADRRSKSDNLLIKLFGIGIYSALLGQDRSIDQLCKLIQKPRSKKEAKVYYQIDSNDVNYEPENEGDVSETEIQNILAYFKRLGRNEERYLESFDSVAAQYTDKQLKVIIKFLPLNVKAVLEANSPRYQQIMSYGMPKTKKVNGSAYKTKLNNNTTKAIENGGIKVESITSGEKKLTKPVIIPPANRDKIQVEDISNLATMKSQKPINITNVERTVPEEPVQEEPTIAENTKEPRRGRGRPKKVKEDEAIQNSIEPRRGRGRPKKIDTKIGEPKENTLPGFEEDVNEETNTIQESDEIKNEELNNNYENNDTILPGFDDDDTLPSIEDEYSQEENTLPGFDEEQNTEDDGSINNNYYNGKQQNEEYQPYERKSEIENYQNKPASVEKLLTNNQKIVSFVGTSKNGTSFLVNNIAELLSNQGIKTAILDLTQNKNSYYIYTKNEESLRKTAFNCMSELKQGQAYGINVNKNLDVYTSLPGENQDEEYETILQTLVENYSLILIDCDFKTNYNYLNESQEIYLVQSMDVLTIQPLTAYLRDLKAKGVLRQEKLKIIINKFIKVRGISERAIIGGMAFYNDPAMAYMTELFNRETIPYCLIPFDVQVYSKYLEALINCSITLNGYTKEFINSLTKLGNMVYPLINGGKTNNKVKYNNPKYNKFASGTFSNDINSTLDKMRGNY